MGVAFGLWVHCLEAGSRWSGFSHVQSGGVQLIRKASCHGFVTSFSEVNRVGAEELEQLVGLCLRGVHDSHQYSRVEDLCLLQPPGVSQVPQKLAQVSNVVPQLGQVFLVPEVGDVTGVGAAIGQ